jgi:glycine dehydrogenase subunit 1
MLAATIYLALQGRKGLEELALQNFSRSEHLKGLLKKAGIQPMFTGPTFNEFAVKLPFSPAEATKAAHGADFIGGFDLAVEYPELEGGYLLCATETAPGPAIEKMASVLGGLK